jgi:hypothetical protein
VGALGEGGVSYPQLGEGEGLYICQVGLLSKSVVRRRRAWS